MANKWSWTTKRKMALECLIQAGGNTRLAAQISEKHNPSVSHAYMEHLKYEARHQPFREVYRRRTGEMLNALEVDTNYVLNGLMELSLGGTNIPASVRRAALRDLGDYLGIWAPRQIEMSVSMIARLEEMGIDAQAVIAEAQRIIDNAGRGVGY